MKQLAVVNRGPAAAVFFPNETIVFQKIESSIDLVTIRYGGTNLLKHVFGSLSHVTMFRCSRSASINDAGNRSFASTSLITQSMAARATSITSPHFISKARNFTNFRRIRRSVGTVCCASVLTTTIFSQAKYASRSSFFCPIDRFPERGESSHHLMSYERRKRHIKQESPTSLHR